MSIELEVNRSCRVRVVGERGNTPGKPVKDVEVSTGGHPALAVDVSDDGCIHLTPVVGVAQPGTQVTVYYTADGRPSGPPKPLSGQLVVLFVGPHVTDDESDGLVMMEDGERSLIG